MRTHKIIFLIGLIFILCQCKKDVKFDYQPKLSSYLYKANNDRISRSERLLFAKKANILVRLLPKDSLYFFYAFKVVNRYWNLQNFDSYKLETKQIIQNSIKYGNKKSLAKGYRYLSEYYNSISKFDSAYFFNYLSSNTYRDLKLKDELARSLLTEAVFQHNQSDFLNAEKKTFQAIKFLCKERNDQLWFQAYNMLGTVYDDLKDFKTSLYYYLKASEIVERGTIPISYDAKAVLLNNIGVLYRNWGNQKKALFYFNKSLKACPTTPNSLNIYAMIIDNIALTNLKLKNEFGVIENLQSAFKIHKKLKNIPATISSQIHLSEYFAYKKNMQKSKYFLKEALLLAKIGNEKSQELEALKQLIRVDSKNALSNFNLYINLQDSLQRSERNMRNKFARIEYETEELQIENKNLLSYQQKLSIFGSIAMAMLVAGFIGRHLIARKREYLLLLDKEFANKEMAYLLDKHNEKIETVRKHEKDRIAQELHDGVMGKLSGIRLNLFLLEKSRDEKTIANCLSKIKEIQDVEREIRTIAYDLDNSLLTSEASFDSLVKNLFASIQEYTHLRFHYYCDPMLKLEMTGNMQKIQLYRILQESLHNVEKYADASVVSVSLKLYKGHLFGYITDNGKGFNLKEITMGIGLKSMHRRVTELKGSLKIDTHKNKGTSIKFNIPLNY